MAKKKKLESSYTRARIDALHTAVAADDREALAELADVRSADGSLLVKRERARAGWSDWLASASAGTTGFVSKRCSSWPMR